MKVAALKLGMLEENCYVIWDSGGIAAVIDPGFDPGLIRQCVVENELQVTHILLTHGHFDHVGAAGELREQTGAKIFIHPDDIPLVQSGGRSAGVSGLQVDGTFRDGEVIEVGELRITVMHTPGHTPGSSMFICDDIIFSGDTLFAGVVGRTDLPGGDTPAMKKSLRRIAALHGDYRVLPGHESFTTLRHEQRHNPYLLRFDYDFYD